MVNSRACVLDLILVMRLSYLYLLAPPSQFESFAQSGSFLGLESEKAVYPVVQNVAPKIQAKHKAWMAAILAAGGPASISAAAFTPVRLHEAQPAGMKAARAQACMVVAWATLLEPTPQLEEAAGIAANAKIHDSTR